MRLAIAGRRARKFAKPFPARCAAAPATRRLWTPSPRMRLGGLARGHKLMCANRTTVVGQRLERLDGAVKATGRFVYGADFALPGTLHGKVLRSTIPHGHLIRIDVTRA